MTIRTRWRSLAAAVSMTAMVAAGGATATVASAAEEGPVDAGITVPQVEGMGEDWINGVDVSSVLSEEESGVVFYDEDGQEADLFQILADHDVNWVRVRVWNDPYDAEGNGYGGGTVDAARATTIAKRATDAGLRVLVNFHYSDFWAHPGQQQLPKAWKDLATVEERAQAVHDYTAETLAGMVAAGVDVGMVQIGNENTPNSSEQIVEVGGWDDFATIVSAGSAAVRETVPDAQVAVHFTNPERGTQPSFAAALDARDVDYDVFLTSYYPFWHGTLENLTSTLSTIATTYDKDVAVAEVSWAYTLEDGDGHENTIRSTYDQYSISVQGQALAIRDVMQAVADVEGGRGLGTFYWEPAWIPVGPADDAAANAVLWEQYGSGWAASYAGSYDPDDAGVYYGGSSWDNQALFDFTGHPLESLRVYQYAVTGAVAPRTVDSVESPSLTVTDGDPIDLPAEVLVSFTDGTSESQAVDWTLESSWIDGPGLYTVTGATSGGYDVSATIEVLDPDAVGENLVVNPGFEDGSTGWTGTGSGFTIGRAEDPHTGSLSTHWYSANANSFQISQTLTGVPAGTYRLAAALQGGGAGPDDVITLSAQSGISTVTTTATLQGYKAWQYPTTSLLHVSEGGTVDLWIDWDMSAGAWGTLDDVTFALGADLPEADLSVLEALVDEAGTLDRDAYSPYTLFLLDKALARAAFVTGSEAPSQEAVDGAATQLDAALEGLEPDDGTVPDPTVAPVSVTVVEGDPIALPDQVAVIAYDETETLEDVVWDDVLALIESPGVYTVAGVTENGWEVTAEITVTVRNWIANGGFEKGVSDVTPWQITAGLQSDGTWPDSSTSSSWVVGYSDIEGGYALNGWSDPWSGPEFWLSAEQTVEALPAGTYALTATTAGGNDLLGGAGETTYELGAWDGTATHSVDLALPGWPDHDTQSVQLTLDAAADVTVWLSADIVPGDWSYADDVSLVRVRDAADTGELDSLLAEAAAIDTALYAPWSVEELDAALAVARIASGADAPSQSLVDSAVAAMSAALDSMVLAPNGTCAVSTKVHGTWPGGFNAQVWLANTSDEDLRGWTMRWSFDGDEEVAHLWSGDVTQDGSDVVVTSKPYNGSLRAGKHLTFGFLGTTTSDSPGLSEVSVNGVACAMGD
ncbi:glycosyl hydrolase 53 family protein [Demequina zhanjiangensis]|uniref:Arabinogalactan endo-beta-1,4-galactanase n=1 Tax=Demequina zhanjiangensis TaxID=3051659 RepID=A0ABT8FY11_9MICO|nr:glycosyl hydrolase 53 family protein [Demequina sp. SYSU T00b26]MDN4471793.1 glycosyl hydrolase 53 family protein [Demequina sp. SYSU T00b26]